MKQVLRSLARNAEIQAKAKELTRDQQDLTELVRGTIYSPSIDQSSA